MQAGSMFVAAPSPITLPHGVGLTELREVRRTAQPVVLSV
jgi:hypothetical protein